MNLELLKNPLPEEAVTPHPTKTYLSSIKAIYVTERFNECFGIGKWKTKVRHETSGQKGMTVVHVTFEVPELNIYYECFGGNDNGGEGSKNFDLGDAYKGATTDALTKIGSYLGVGIDVFKGLHKPTNKKQDNTPVEWLSEKNYNSILKMTKEKIKGYLSYYDGKTVREGKKYSMKKAYRENLTSLCK